jgi:hypothetical protein
MAGEREVMVLIAIIIGSGGGSDEKIYMIRPKG